MISEGSVPLRVGLVGAGITGRRHAAAYRALAAECALVGVVDPDPRAIDRLVLSGFPSISALGRECDALSICSPSDLHLEHLAEALDAGCHVIVEKPVAPTLAGARHAVALATAHPDLVVQVGHLERFNPAFAGLRRILDGAKPLAVVAHRSGSFRPTGADVIGDLMIHDLDLLLVLTNRVVVEVEAVGGRQPDGLLDVVDATLTFADGLVAELHANSRERAGHRHRRFLVTTRDGHVEMDLLAQRLRGQVNGHGRVDRADPLLRQIAAFLDAVTAGHPSPVSPAAVLPAAELADRLRAAIG